MVKHAVSWLSARVPQFEHLLQELRLLSCHFHSHCCDGYRSDCVATRDIVENEQFLFRGGVKGMQDAPQQFIICHGLLLARIWPVLALYLIVIRALPSYRCMLTPTL